MTVEKPLFDMIAFDADDTLWHNEPLFTMTHEKFKKLLEPYHGPSWIQKRLSETEIKNLNIFGYGAKGFTLSMIETAIELTEGRIQGNEIQRILNFGKQMLDAPVKLLEHVEDTISKLSKEYSLMIITKGDLLDQESKIARSGLAEYFDYIEIVSDKTEAIYKEILKKYKLLATRFLMVGNSLRSDILPVKAINAHAVHVHYESTWAHEQISEDELTHLNYIKINRIDELPKVLTESNFK